MSEERRVGGDAIACHRQVAGVEVDQHGAALHRVGHEANGAGAAERVKHGVALARAGGDATAGQLLREGGEVAPLKGSVGKVHTDLGLRVSGMTAIASSKLSLFFVPEPASANLRLSPAFVRWMPSLSWPVSAPYLLGCGAGLPGGPWRWPTPSPRT